MVAETVPMADFSDGVISRMRTEMKNTAHLSRSLINARITRSHFDPTSHEDRVAYQVFLKTGRWIKLYYCEKPSLSITATVERKIIEHALRDVLTAADQVIEELVDPSRNKAA